MPNVPTTPYDSAGYILQQAIIKTGDTAGPAGLAGNILNPNQPGIIPQLNTLYRELQDRLISLGVETFTKYWYIVGIPPAATSNPSVQVHLDFIGYFNGDIVLPNWRVPPDCLKPVEIWQRQTGNNRWIRMIDVPDAIETRPIVPFPNCWDYKNDTLFLPPWNQTVDLKIKGLCYAPDITTVNSPVLVPRCQSALAYRMAAEVAGQRGGLEMAAVWQQKAVEAENEIVNRTAIKEQFQSFVRRPFRNRNSRRRRSGG